MGYITLRRKVEEKYNFRTRIEGISLNEKMKRIAVAGNNCLSLWNIRNEGGLELIAECAADSVKNLAFSPDGDFLAACGDRFLTLYRIE